MSRTVPNGRIPSLDGLRAVAISLVLGEHGWKTLPPWARNSVLVPIIGNGGLGVYIFFVISGFLITHLLMEERAASGTISIKNFYIRRGFRIWPAFYVFLAIVGLLGFAGAIHLRTLELLSSALYVWNYSLGNTTWFLGHTWSLAIEEQFYFIWPLAFKILDVGAGRIAAGLVIAASPLIRIGTYFLTPHWKGHIGMMLHTRADALMFGALTAMLYGEPSFQRLLQACFRKKAHVWAFVFLFLISPLLVLKFRGAYALPIGLTLDGFCCVLILVWAVQNPSSLVGKVLNSRPIVHIGVLSYSLYLWQQMFMTDLNRTFTGAFPFNLICAFLAAELSYRAIEKPFLRLRAQYFARPALSPGLVESPVALR